MAGIGDALGGNRSRWRGDLVADGLGQIEVPPLRQIERADNDADAPARHNDPHHLGDRAIGVAPAKFRVH